MRDAFTRGDEGGRGAVRNAGVLVGQGEWWSSRRLGVLSLTFTSAKAPPSTNTAWLAQPAAKQRTWRGEAGR